MTYGWNEDFTAFAGLGEPQGTLADWASAANMLFAAGCEAQSMALLASFASPLMALLPVDEPGAVVSIWGGRGKGKSTALTAAVTVWLDADTLLAATRDLPLVFQNLANRDPTIVRQMLEGAKTAHAGLLISAAGLPVLAPLYPQTLPVLEAISPRDEVWPGIEFQIALPKGLIQPKDKNRLEAVMRQNRGTAGAAYIAYLLSGDNVLDWLEVQLGARVAQIRDQTGTGDAHRFQHRAIAACWVAGMIVSRIGILEFDADRVAKWAIAQTFPKTPAP